MSMIPMSDMKVDVPTGRSGKWKIDRFTVSKEKARDGLFDAFLTGRYVPAGTYTRLKHDGQTVMSDTPDEIRDHLKFLREAKGDVLIAGLGIGMCVRACMLDDRVKSVTVIEKSPNVIKLVAPWLKGLPGADKLTIIEADIFEWLPPKGQAFDYAWFDIWNSIHVENLPEMAKLHRKFGRIAKKKGSWGRDILDRDRRAEARRWSF